MSPNIELWQHHDHDEIEGVVGDENESIPSSFRKENGHLDIKCTNKDEGDNRNVIAHTGGNDHLFSLGKSGLGSVSELSSDIISDEAIGVDEYEQPEDGRDYDNDSHISCDCVGDTSDYNIPVHFRAFSEEFDDSSILFQDLLRLELRVAELESQLYDQQQMRRRYMLEEAMDEISVRTLQKQKNTLEQENSTLMHKLVGMHENIFSERINALKHQQRLQDEIVALKSEMNWISERNDSLLKTNLELKSMLKKSEKVKDKRRKSLEGELVCPFPTDGERQLRRMSSGSNDSSSNTASTERSDLLKELLRAIMLPSETSVSTPTTTRKAMVKSTETCYVPFPKESRTGTVSGMPLAPSKHSKLVDVLLSFIPRLGRTSSCGNPVQLATSFDHVSSSSGVHSELSYQHESWSPADEINIQTELFNVKKSMAKTENALLVGSA